MQIHQDNRIHVSTVGDNGIILATQRKNVRVGTPIYTGKLAIVRNTYPAIYNHVVRNMNSIIGQTKEKKKRSMRGGHFFLYRYVILLAFILCLVFGIVSIYAKGCAAVSLFFLFFIYFYLSTILLSVYSIIHSYIHF